MFNLGVERIHKTQDFETGLSKWFKRPAVEHTCNIFKSHCIADHTALKQMRGPILINYLYHQANQMASELNKTFKTIIDEVLMLVHALVDVQYVAQPVEAVE